MSPRSRIRITQAARIKERMADRLGEPPDRAWLEERAQAWRPYRTWVVLLLRVLLEAETGDIGGTRDVGGHPR